ncbi:hypothetical protein BsBEST3102_38020 [Bacillus subtilis]|nr:hypothetical protein NBRC13719_38210 [Bacillus subtilis subsp. subtilis]BCV72784.1 hypothetical protein BsBEST3095_38050 [Bacillus subtilis]BCV77010.1 hypothetical protein BsBEST3096_38120 [Bacillus subtilis]BCV81242.1 hypothetical protein BsBEST3102_38020 [Bacillus subtilis]BCV85474.1 hypothetical protein BsBEST3106_38020 [Bacillus subtilis]
MKQDADIITKSQVNLKNSPKHGYKDRMHRLKTPVFFLYSDNIQLKNLNKYIKKLSNFLLLNFDFDRHTIAYVM